MGGGAPKKSEYLVPSMATEKKSTFKGSAGINDGGEVGLGDDERVGDELIYTKAKTLDELETAICAADTPASASAARSSACCACPLGAVKLALRPSCRMAQPCTLTTFDELSAGSLSWREVVPHASPRA